MYYNPPATPAFRFVIPLLAGLFAASGTGVCGEEPRPDLDTAPLERLTGLKGSWSAALESGLEVTALHNHFLFEKPRVFFIHVAGDGPADTLASGILKTLAAVKTVRAATPRPSTAISRFMKPSCSPSSRPSGRRGSTSSRFTTT